ncbi:hypothetical protein ACO1O0_003666 [Amphichorda felina]
MHLSFLAPLAVAGTAFAANPLATEEQRALDILATEINLGDDFQFLREAARTTIRATLKLYGKTIDKQVSDDIDLAADELKAVNSDPANPKVYWTDAAPRNQEWFGLSVPGGRYSYDNTDCIYRTIPISHKYDYLIHGKRTSAGPADVTFSLISNPNSQGTVAALTGDDLVVDSDGSFTIKISAKESNETNFIQSDWSVVQLFVRNNLGDWNQETPDDITVEVVGADDAEPVSKDKIISRSKTNLAESTFFYGFGALNIKTLFLRRVNTLDNPTQSATLGTLTTQASSFGHFDLADDESLVVTFAPGKSTYWVLPVYSLGMITNSPWSDIVSFNNKQATVNSNGTYTFVVSKKDPGVYNWLSTSNHTQGTIMGRWQGLPTDGDTDNGIEVISSVVALDALGDVLPAETRYVTPEEREEQLKERIEGYDRIHQQ